MILNDEKLAAMQKRWVNGPLPGLRIAGGDVYEAMSDIMELLESHHALARELAEAKDAKQTVTQLLLDTSAEVGGLKDRMLDVEHERDTLQAKVEALTQERDHFAQNCLAQQPLIEKTNEQWERIQQLEAILATLPAGAIETLQKWYEATQRAEQAEAQLAEAVVAIEKVRDDLMCRMTDGTPVWEWYREELAPLTEWLTRHGKGGG